jgi:hypothetical protein
MVCASTLCHGVEVLDSRHGQQKIINHAFEGEHVSYVRELDLAEMQSTNGEFLPFAVWLAIGGAAGQGGLGVLSYLGEQQRAGQPVSAGEIGGAFIGNAIPGLIWSGFAIPSTVVRVTTAGLLAAVHASGVVAETNQGTVTIDQVAPEQNNNSSMDSYAGLDLSQIPDFSSSSYAGAAPVVGSSFTQLGRQTVSLQFAPPSPYDGYVVVTRLR